MELEWESVTTFGDCYFVCHLDDTDIEIQINYFGKDRYSVNIEKFDELVFEEDILKHHLVEDGIDKFIKRTLSYPTTSEFEEIFIESQAKA